MQKKWLLVFDFQNRSKEISIFFGIFSYRELQTKKNITGKDYDFSYSDKTLPSTKTNRLSKSFDSSFFHFFQTLIFFIC